MVAAEEVQRLLEMAGQQRQPNEILVYLQSLLPGLEESFFKGEQ